MTDQDVVTLHRTHYAFADADKAWGEAIASDPIASRTIDARYLPAGRGAPGSRLRAAHDAREAARIAWEKARGLS